MKTGNMKCWVARRAIANRIDTAPNLTPWLRRHLASCGPCQSYHQSQIRIIHGLSREAGLARVSTPPFLEGRIRAAVRHSGTSREAGRRSWRPVWAMVLMPVLLLIVAVVLSLRPPSVQETNVDKVEVSQLTRTADALESQLSRASGDALLRLGQRLEQPLEKEMRFVMNDARVAVAALADSFLTDAMREALRQ